MIKQTKDTASAKKIIHFAGTSILATGLVAAPGATLAASHSPSSLQTPPSYQMNHDAPEVYAGDSIAYFKQKFFKGQSSLTVGESGSIPIAQSLNFTIKRSVVLSSKLQATDEDELDTLSYQLMSQPSSGILTLDGKTGEFTYIGHDEGTYTFSYQVIDSQEHSSDPATVTIIVEKDKEKNKNKQSATSAPTEIPAQPVEPTVPVASGDMTIDAVHTDNAPGTPNNSTGRTRGVATLSAASTEQKVVLNILSERIANTIKEAQVKQNIAIDATVLKDKQQYQLNFTGDIVQNLLNKQNGLTLQTGDLQVQLPSAALSRMTQQQNLGITDAAKWTLTAQKVALPANSNWNGAVITPLSNTAYELKLAVNDANNTTNPSSYENRYVKLGFIVPEAVNDPGNYIALATDPAGNTYIVPVTFDAQWQATVHTLEGSTVHIAKVTTPATSGGSSAVDLLQQKQIIPFIDRAPAQSDASLTRGELALYLSRALGVNTANSSGSAFTDLDANSEQSRAIAALSKVGVLKGISMTTFAPDRVISREQLAVILTRAAAVYGLSETGTTTISTDTTSNSASKWAQQELQQELVQGNDTGIRSSGNRSLSAQPDMSESEGAQMLVDWLQNAKLLN
ncbi:Ig-like domain-containing protein [Paenibacillus sp. SGZ-1009]|uniref:Ig-like domain-containing protein n=1 Tax=Paenibacillus campi TaxID=3106031 RepID=UPI002AFDE0C2|nr:S-layer homology domain-containing protein [Paenibacillus sp. SGZ-1009]